MFSSLSRRRVVVLLILTSLLLITLDRRSNNAVIDKTRQAFAVIMRPFDTAVEAVSKPIANAWYGITHYDDLKAENEALHDQVEHQKGAEIEAQTAITKFYELLKLYRLTSVHSYKSVIAQVVGEAPSNFQNTVEITVGTRDGIAVGMPVTDGAGLIGKVTQVYPDRSVVMLITDPQFSVQAQVLSRVDCRGCVVDQFPVSDRAERPPAGRDVHDQHHHDGSTGVGDHHDDRHRQRDAGGVHDLDELDDDIDHPRSHRAPRDRRHRWAGR